MSGVRQRLHPFTDLRAYKADTLRLYLALSLRRSVGDQRIQVVREVSLSLETRSDSFESSSEVWLRGWSRGQVPRPKEGLSPASG